MVPQGAHPHPPGCEPDPASAVLVHSPTALPGAVEDTHQPSKAPGVPRTVGPHTPQDSVGRAACAGALNAAAGLAEPAGLVSASESEGAAEAPPSSLAAQPTAPRHYQQQATAASPGSNHTASQVLCLPNRCIGDAATPARGSMQPAPQFVQD